MSHSDFEPGDLIADRYTVIELLGKGGMGKVFRCRDKLLDKEVAIKLLLSVDAEKEAMRFQIEAKATARLNHPNILRILDFGQTESGELFLAAEYLKGRSLASEVDGYGPYKVEEALDLTAHVASALSHAHKNHVLHRDVKPSNVMLVDEEDGSRTIRLVDFGLAKVTAHDDRLTGTGVGLGSPAYCSPEQGDGKAVDERSDIYSVGCLLFYLLTGHPPFQADNPLATIFMHLQKEPPTLAEKGGTDFPAPVEALVAKCLAKKPSERPQSCDELIELIAEAQRDDPDAEPVLQDGSEKKGPKGKKVLVIAAASLAGVLLVLLVVFGIDQALLSGSLTNRMLAHKGTTSNEPRGPVIVDHSEAVELEGTWTDNDLRRLIKDPNFFQFMMNDQKKVRGDGLVVLERSHAENVDLKGSGIDDRAFDHLSKMKGIRELILDNCINITDSGIIKMAGSKSLARLHLAGTRVTDKIFEPLSRCPELDHIDLSNCHQVTGKSLGKMQNLAYLIMEDDPNIKPQLSVLKTLPKLTELNLSNCALGDSDLAEFKDLNLESLKLRGNYITDDGIIQLQSLRSLKRLDLSNCTRVTLKGIKALRSKLPENVSVLPDLDQATNPSIDPANKPHLVQPSGAHKFHEAFGEWRAKDIPLKIGNDVTYLRFREMDNDLSGFEQLKESKLRILDLTKCSIRDKDLEHLKALPNLEHLLLNECHNITDEGIGRLRSMPLSSLELLETNITDRGVAYAGEIKTLRNLNLERCPNIKGSTLGTLKSVRSISLKDSSGLDGKNLGKLLSIPHIDHLGLSNVGLKDSDIASMAGVHVRRIHLSNNPELGDKTLAVLSALKDLEWAEVSGCRRITRKGIDQFYERTVSEGRNVELHGVQR
ncbi:MAG: protein kinase [Cyanobacteria bacterium HKST-UBA02]|nr:protein kinase [Cyanobacteria bacterium HKST-UBA02]